MKDKLVKFHRRASYYRTRKVAFLALALMFVTASVALPLSLMSVEGQQAPTSSEVSTSETGSLSE